MFSRNYLPTVLVPLILFCAALSAMAQSQADSYWVNKHLDQALRDLFPIERFSGMGVAYRSHRDLYTNTLEYSFFIGHDVSPAGRAYSHASAPSEADSVSVYDQMMALHRRSPNLSAADIQKKLHVRHGT